MSLSQRIFQEKRRLIYPLVVVLIVNVLIFAAVVYPLSLKVAAADRTAQAASIAAMSARREFDSAKNTVTGKAAADAELKKFYGEVLPPDQSAARRITSLKIAQLAKKTNVNDERAVSEVTQERDSSLGKLSTDDYPVGAVPRHPAFHLRARGRTRISDSRDRVAVAGLRCVQRPERDSEGGDLLSGRWRWNLKTRSQAAAPDRGC